MQPHKDLRGTSGITQYESGDDYIDLEFRGDKVYRYDGVKPGSVHVTKMKELASSDADLANYVNQNVRKNFADQLR